MTTIQLKWECLLIKLSFVRSTQTVKKHHHDFNSSFIIGEYAPTKVAALETTYDVTSDDYYVYFSI